MVVSVTLNTITESTAANGSYTVGDNHGGETAATRESNVADGGDTVRDDRIVASNNQCVCGCFDDCITVLT